MEEINLVDGRKIVIEKWNDIAFSIKEFTEAGQNMNTFILPCDLIDEFIEKIKREAGKDA